ncbi:MAG TPA: phosphohistidine phosphatase SixA [Candidatus Binatia bacterium]|jgi:phosphohistidine phosphatase|nr:phosphohistidine phosphatase SixA [Candidatus Binatia bacterium]
MNVYLMRHGIAQPKDDPKIGSDDERELTKKGAKKARKAAKGLRALKIPFDRIITSPLSRARETAEIVAKVFDMEEQVEEAPELKPQASVESLAARLLEYRDCQELLLVGHQPFLGKAASLLLCRNESANVELKKSGICCIELNELDMKKPGVLRWMLTPRQLRKLRYS